MRGLPELQMSGMERFWAMTTLSCHHENVYTHVGWSPGPQGQEIPVLDCSSRPHVLDDSWKTIGLARKVRVLSKRGQCLRVGDVGTVGEAGRSTASSMREVSFAFCALARRRSVLQGRGFS